MILRSRPDTNIHWYVRWRTRWWLAWIDRKACGRRNIFRYVPWPNRLDHRFLVTTGQPNDIKHDTPVPNQTSTRTDPKPTSDLSTDAYKIWLGREYSITKNDLFGKYECDSKLFDSLDEALVHADAIEKTRELEKHLEEEAKRQKSREDAERINKWNEDAQRTQKQNTRVSMIVGSLIFVIVSICVFVFAFVI